MDKFCVFHVEGGLGKNVAATAVVNRIAEKHTDRKMIVVASYPEVFFNNPNVYRVFRMGMSPYFYQDYIEGKDTIIFRQEPYFTTDHILHKKSLIQNWTELCGMSYEGGLPQLYYNTKQENIFSMKWNRQKPILLIQTTGGMFKGQDNPMSWTRDMPYDVAMRVANEFAKTHHIMQICRENSYIISNAEVINMPLSNMELLYLVNVANKRLLIDSCLQHAAASFGKKSTVLWIGTKPAVFGYALHDNILPNVDKFNTKLVDSYLFDYSFVGNLHEYPYNTEKIFDIEQIFNSLNN